VVIASATAAMQEVFIKVFISILCFNFSILPVIWTLLSHPFFNRRVPTSLASVAQKKVLATHQYGRRLGILQSSSMGRISLFGNAADKQRF
jgi:hypothetical protein